MHLESQQLSFPLSGCPVLLYFDLFTFFFPHLTFDVACRRFGPAIARDALVATLLSHAIAEVWLVSLRGCM